MSIWPNTQSDFEYGRLSERLLRFEVTIYGSATLANIKAAVTSTSGFNAVKVYVASDVQPTSIDTTANFPVLVSNAAPSTVAVLINSGDVKKILSVNTLPLTISPTGTMTGGVTANPTNLFGNANTGVTLATKNGAFTIACTGFAFNTANTIKFTVEVRYEALANA